MRSPLFVLTLAVSSSVFTFACNEEMTPPAAPTSQVAPVTTVVLDAGVAAAPLTSAPVDPVDAGAATATAAPDAGATASAGGADFYSCGAAADCVAIPKNGCCHNGFNEAVNKSSVDAYRASAPKCDPRQKCPMFRILDKRTPDCSAGKCVLVQPSGGGSGP